MTHGDADEVVPISESEVLQAALQAAGVPAELVTVPGTGHNVSLVWPSDSGSIAAPCSFAALLDTIANL